MKKFATWGLMLVLVLAVGCASAGRNTGPGVLLGSAIGAGAGAIIGHQTGNAGQGALIGAGLGGLTGGLIGNALDRVEEEAAVHDAQNAAAIQELRYVQGQLSILDVIRMSQAGVSDSIIVAKIDQSHSYFDLSAEEIIDLRMSGVSDTVIEHILWRGGEVHPDGRFAPTAYDNAYYDYATEAPVTIGLGFGVAGSR